MNDQNRDEARLFDEQCRPIQPDPLDEPTHIKTMARSDDHPTSVDAAASIDLKGHKVIVLAAAVAHGKPFTDPELWESLKFQRISESSARSRRSQLEKPGFIANTGGKRDGFTIWTVTEAGREALAKHNRLQGLKAA